MLRVHFYDERLFFTPFQNSNPSFSELSIIILSYRLDIVDT